MMNAYIGIALLSCILTNDPSNSMNNITEIFSKKPRTFSCELFPPKTEQGYTNLIKTIDELAVLKPDFISCTYGAGGGSRDKTIDIVEHIQNKKHIAGLAHLTCVLHTKDEIKAILDNMHNRGIHNVLALRGDPPLDRPDWQPTEINFKYSSALCAFIRKNFNNTVSIGVAGFPEGHVLCKDREKDADFLKLKIDCGADFVITQLFFNNQDYFSYVKRLRQRGVTKRIIPGILSITNYPSLVKFSQLCGATLTPEVKSIFEPIQDNPEETLKAGIQFAIRQCRELLEGGAPGIHFYCLNKLHPTDEILSAIRS
jgi:methylenetetrahydrofolate reductase (NADPH)